MGWLDLGFSSTYSERTHRQSGTDEVATPQGARTYGNVYAFSGSLGLWRGLSLRVVFPILDITAIEGEEPATEESAEPPEEAMDMEMGDADGETHVVGLGDLSVLLHYLFVSKQIPPTWRLGFGVGAFLPTGGTSSADIPSNPAFRSGTVDPQVTYNGSYDFPFGLGFYTHAFARLVVAENADGYRASHSISYGGGLRYRLWGVLIPSVGVTALHRFHERRDGARDPNSGGDWLYVTGGLSFAWNRGVMAGISCFLAVQLPVYQRLNGTQFAEDYNVTFGLGYGFQTFGD